MKKTLIKKVVAIATVGALACFGLAGCGGSASTSSSAASGASSSASSSASASADTTIRIGASPTPHAIILDKVKDALSEKGYKLDVVEYNDYVLPNTALESGELDANYFQHITYLNDFNEESGTHLVSAVGVHFEPFGLYAGKTQSVADLKEGATIAVPNDTTNEARALLLLEQEGLIKLKEGAGLTATALDIADNPLNLRIQEVEAAQLPRVLPDVDMAAINGNYALESGLSVDDALAVEGSQSDAAEAYVNVIAVREGTELQPKIQALVEAITSPDVRTYIESEFKGAVVPLF